jgi:hypothetical protein
MPDRPPCEHVDVAISLQQLIRSRDGDGATDAPSGAVVEVDTLCGKPSDVFVETADGARAYCAAHVRERMPSWAADRHP